MPVAISQQQIDAPPSVLRRKPWTRNDVRAVASTGAFDGRRYELIGGALIDKMSTNPPHVFFLHLLASWMRQVFGEFSVRTNAPIDVAPEDNPTSQPEPDICVTTWTLRQRPGAVPTPADVVLLVEISDTTLSFDTKDKAGLYARAGIQDYWVLDVNQRRIIVHRSPAQGEYQSLTVYSGSESVSPLAAPHASVRLADFDGPLE